MKFSLGQVDPFQKSNNNSSCFLNIYYVFSTVLSSVHVVAYLIFIAGITITTIL